MFYINWGVQANLSLRAPRKYDCFGLELGSGGGSPSRVHACSTTLCLRLVLSALWVQAAPVSRHRWMLGAGWCLQSSLQSAEGYGLTCRRNAACLPACLPARALTFPQSGDISEEVGQCFFFFVFHYHCSRNWHHQNHAEVFEATSIKR